MWINNEIMVLYKEDNVIFIDLYDRQEYFCSYKYMDKYES